MPNISQLPIAETLGNDDYFVVLHQGHTSRVSLANLFAGVDSALSLLAPLNSPSFTGVPIGPTAVYGTNTTQLATTAFVQAGLAGISVPVTSVFGRTGAVIGQTGDYTVSQITGAAPLASPGFTGTATITGTANAFALAVAGPNTSSQSYGLAITAGTNNNDIAFSVISRSLGQAIFVRGDGLICLGGNSTSPGASVHVRAADASTKGLIVQGAPAQTANLTEWYDASGNLKAWVTAAGVASFASFPVISGLTQGSILFSGSSGTVSQNNSLLFWDDSSGRLGVGASSSLAARLHVQAPTSGKAAVFRAAATTPDNIVEWQNSSGTVLSYMGPTGSLVVGGSLTIPNGGGATISGGITVTSSEVTVLDAGYMTTSTVMTAKTASTVAVVVKAAPSQTANFQEWQNSSGTARAYLDSSGLLVALGGLYSGGTINGNTVGPNAGNQFTIRKYSANGGPAVLVIPAAGDNGVTLVAPYSTGVAAIVQGASSQTANLQEWQNSSGTVLSSITSAGLFTGSGLGLTGIPLSVSNSDGTLTISPTTGAVVASLALGHANTWTAAQTFQAPTSGKAAVFKAAVTTPDNIAELRQGDNTLASYFDSAGRLVIATASQNGSTPFICLQGDATTGIAMQGVGAVYIKSSGLYAMGWQNNAIESGRMAAYFDIGRSGTLYFADSSNYKGAITNGVSGGVMIYSPPGFPSVTTLTVKATPSQSANLQEWQDSSGTALSYIDSSGRINISSALQNASLAFLKLPSENTGIGLQSIGAIGFVSNGRTAFLVQDNAYGDGLAALYTNTTSARITLGSSGDSVISRNTSGGGVVVRADGSTTSTVLTIKAAPSQSANLTEWQNSSGTVLSGVDSGGRFFGATSGMLLSTNGAGDTNYGFAAGAGYPLIKYAGTTVVGFGNYFGGCGAGIQPASASHVALILRGTTSQAAALLEISTPTTNDDPTLSLYQNRVATTDATQTTLHTIALADDTVYAIKVRVLARRTGGVSGAAGDSALYERLVRAKRTGGGAATLGNIQETFTDEDQTGWDCTFTVSGNNVLVSVTGQASTNITWHLLKAEVSPLST